MTTPIQPPTIDAHALPSTPAREWADDTASAIGTTAAASTTSASTASIPPPLFTGSPRAPQLVSSASTPGPELPGAFPRAYAAPPLDAETAKAAAQSVIETARSYLPSQQAVQDALGGAEAAARQYLPDAVTSYFPASSQTPNATLPSKEFAGDTSGKSAGAGGLPGTVFESGVAKLPEERAKDGELRTPAGETISNAYNSTKNTTAQYIPDSTSVSNAYNNTKDTAGQYVPDTTGATNSLANAYNVSKNTAAQYIPDATAVTTALASAKNTAAQRLPESVTSRLPATTVSTTHTSLPSTELAGDTSGSSAGAGGLPGPIYEASVARLPDERSKSRDGAHPISTTTNTTSHLAADAATPPRDAHTGGVGNLPGAPSETGVALLPEERAHPTAFVTTATKGGVGELPGAPGESSVALLPEERAQRNTVEPYPTTATATDTTTRKTGGVGDLPGVRSEADAALLPAERAEVHAQHAEGLGYGNKPAGPAAGAGAVEVADAPTPAAAHPPPVHTSPSNAPAAKPAVHASHSDAAPPVPPKSASPSRHAKRASTSSADGSQHRASFMDKLKGEAKVLSGKLGKNEEKVEEGRRLMGKST